MSSTAVSGAVTRYRVMAWITGVFLIVMSAAMIAKYGYGIIPGWYGIGWQMHGFFYAVYLLAVLDVAVRLQWNPVRIVLVALAGTIPVVGIVAERTVTRDIK